MKPCIWSLKPCLILSWFCLPLFYIDTPDVYASNTTDTLSDHIERSSNSTETDGMQQQIQTHKQLQESEESWEMLKDDLQQLNTVIHEFSTHVNVSRL